MILYLTLIEDEGNKKKFEHIYNAHHNTVYHVAIGILKDEHLAQDAMQETFVKVAKNIDKIEDVNSVVTRRFLIIISKNIALDYLRSRKKMIPVQDIEAFLPQVNSSELDVIGNITERAIIEKILEIPIVYREVLELSIMHSLSVKEISEVLNLKRDTVYKRLQRGRKLLQNKLIEGGIYEERIWE